MNQKRRYILAIDQGTTSTRAMLFNQEASCVAIAQQTLSQHFPQPGWVEHDPQEIWTTVIETVREVLRRASCPAGAVRAAGVTNQRETVIVWDKHTGKPVYPAIVWQDRRAAKFCRRKRKAENMIRAKTGLPLDPYFSAVKIAWILDHVVGARQRAERGELLAGTVDSFVLWRLTGGHVHATDITNACRTLLFNINTCRWDKELLHFFTIPAQMLPQVRDNTADFGVVDEKLFGAAFPVTGMAGDQQAALIGQACLSPGDVKITYGTGAFMLINTGKRRVHSRQRLLSTIAYRLRDQTVYALEGSIFMAGATVQWLRDKLGLILNAQESEQVAASDNGGVYLVPAFVGLGAPYWRPQAKAAIVGLTRDSGKAQIVRAALESVAYQTRDLLEAAAREEGVDLGNAQIRVDGGMSRNDLLMQFTADMLRHELSRGGAVEATATGAAFLAGLGCGFYPSLEHVAALWRQERRFAPAMDKVRRQTLYWRWHDAVRQTCDTTSVAESADHAPSLATGRERDEYYMRLALAQARSARDAGEVPVGAVLVDAATGEVLAQAHNQVITLCNPGAHAEMLVLREAGMRRGNYRLNDTVLYVTLEPCMMCSAAAVHARIRRLVFGAFDPKTGACGTVTDALGHPMHNWCVECVGGVLAEPCGESLRDFFRSARKAEIRK